MEDLDNVVIRSTINGIKFNNRKCKIMNLGTNNKDFGCKKWYTDNQGREGPVMSVNNRMTMSCQCDAAVGSIRQGIFSRNKEVYISLYKVLLKPQVGI